MMGGGESAVYGSTFFMPYSKNFISDFYSFGKSDLYSSFILFPVDG